MKIETELEFEKSTKNTHVYCFRGEGECSIPTLYINKSALPKEPPKVIRITIEAAK